MKDRIGVADVGAGVNLSDVDVVIHEATVVILPPPIEPYHLFVGEDKIENQPWKKRGKNIKC